MAKLVGVSTTAINNRIKNGTIEVEELQQPDGTLKRYINTEVYPPEKIMTDIRTYPIESQRWGKKKG